MKEAVMDYDTLVFGLIFRFLSGIGKCSKPQKANGSSANNLIVPLYGNLKINFAMKHLVDLSWLSNMAFQTNLDGHQLTIDASTEGGGEDLGPRPKKLLLVALAGCTGIDVIMILKKMKVIPEGFNVMVEGDLTDEQPVKYHTVKIIYQFKGTDLPMDKLQRAVDLSQEKYCGVSANLRDALTLETEIRIVD